MTLTGRDVREALNALREEQAKAHREGQSSVVTTRICAEFMRNQLRQLFEQAHAQLPDAPPVALVALGSAGRMEMSPYSDVDIALITPKPQAPGLRDLVDGILYPLWDARLEVGHAVRTPSEFAELANDDDTVRTTAVDCQGVCGNAQVLAELDAALRRALGGSRTKRYLKTTLSQWTDQHSPGTVYRLEPNLKTGPGGLRELQRVWWVARLVWRIDSWGEILNRALVSSHDYDILMRGRETMLGIRLALHFCAKRRQDQLRFDLQDDVAEHLGFGRNARDLLAHFYREAKAVRAATTRILERCAETMEQTRRPPRIAPVDGFIKFEGRLTLADPHQFEKNPLDLVRIFRVAQTHDLRLHGRARARIAEVAAGPVGASLAKNPAAQRLFADMLGDPRGDANPLELMHEHGVLECLVPELEAVVGLAQRDIYHTYTVDAHLVACASRAMALTLGRVPDCPPDIRAVAERIDRPHLLVLAALLHDIGKGHGHGHSERGAVMAEEVARRMELDGGDTDDLIWLVREHLTMFRLSQRRDLEDPSLIQQFAASVENHERLDLLYALSFCDATTTGPAAWNDWKASLVRELYQRTRVALSQGAGVENLRERAKARLDKLLHDRPQDASRVRALAERVSPRHLVTYRDDLLVRHAHGLWAADHEGAYAHCTPEERWGSWEIVVVGKDRPGLLADLAAVLAARGVSIDAAQISSTQDDAPLVIDTFVVRGGEWPQLEEEARRLELEGELRAAVNGMVDVEKRLGERRRSAAALQSGAPAPETRVVYDLGVQANATVVDVFAPDRVGLLHAVASAIFAAGASIILARISTEGEKAVDSFYVIDSTTREPLGEEGRERLREAILKQITP